MCTTENLVLTLVALGSLYFRLNQYMYTHVVLLHKYFSIDHL